MTRSHRASLVAIPDLEVLCADVDLSLTGPVVGGSGWPDLLVALLDPNGRVSADQDVVFPQLPTHPSGAAHWRTDGSPRISIQLDLVPGRVHRLVVALLSAPGGLRAGQAITLRVADRTGRVLHELTGPAVGRAVDDAVFLVGEFYRVPAGWRFRGIGFGLSGQAEFCSRIGAANGTMATRLARNLATHAGKLAAVAPPNPPPPPPAPPPAERRSPVPRPTGSALRKVDLEAGGEATIARPEGRVEVALKWLRTSKDLDLYALYIDRKGRAGVCYYRQQGSLRKPPYICLTSGDRRGKETIEIARTDELSYVLLCAYSAVENGVGSFRSFRAYAEVDNGLDASVRVPLYHRNSFSYWVAIALVDLTGPDIGVRHVETYSRSRSENRPVLYPNGKFQMDKGPVEFKTVRW